MGGSWLAKKQSAVFSRLWRVKDWVSVTGTDQSPCEGKLMKQAMVY